MPWQTSKVLAFHNTIFAKEDTVQAYPTADLLKELPEGSTFANNNMIYLVLSGRKVMVESLDDDTVRTISIPDSIEYEGINYNVYSGGPV